MTMDGAMDRAAVSAESREACRAALAMREPSVILALHCSFLSAGRRSKVDIRKNVLCVYWPSSLLGGIGGQPMSRLSSRKGLAFSSLYCKGWF